MAIVCHNLKLIFIQMPNSGSTSIEKVLEENFDGEKVFFIDSSGNKVYKKHITLEELAKKKAFSPSIISGYVTAVSIRNPFDRVVSNFRRRLDPVHFEDAFNNPNHPLYTTDQKILKMVSEDVALAKKEGFEGWVSKNYGYISRLQKWKRWVFQGAIPYGIEYQAFTENINQILRYEEGIEDEFNKMLSSLGVNDYVKLKNFNPTKNPKKYTDYFTPKSRKIIENIYYRDLQKYGYSFSLS